MGDYSYMNQCSNNNNKTASPVNFQNIARGVMSSSRKLDTRILNLKTVILHVYLEIFTCICCHLSSCINTA